DPLIQAADWAIYGTATEGGSYGWGTAFKMNLDGSGFSVLYDFNLNGDSGYWPSALCQGTDLNLYGTTPNGNPANDSALGTIFRITPSVAGWSNYGAGLAGTLGVPSLTASANPVLGTSFDLTVDNSRGQTTTAVMFIGMDKAKIKFRGGMILVGNT